MDHRTKREQGNTGASIHAAKTDMKSKQHDGPPRCICLEKGLSLSVRHHGRLTFLQSLPEEYISAPLSMHGHQGVCTGTKGYAWLKSVIGGRAAGGSHCAANVRSATKGRQNHGRELLCLSV